MICNDAEVQFGSGANTAECCENVKPGELCWTLQQMIAVVRRAVSPSSVSVKLFEFPVRNLLFTCFL